MGYYDFDGVVDPTKGPNPTMQILLSGDGNRVKSEYVKRKLDILALKPDSSIHYQDEATNLMAQILHCHERLTEAQSQIAFLKSNIFRKTLDAHEMAQKDVDGSKALIDISLRNAIETVGNMVKIEKVRLARQAVSNTSFELLIEQIEGLGKILEDVKKENCPRRKRCYDELSADQDANVVQTNEGSFCKKKKNLP